MIGLNSPEFKVGMLVILVSSLIGGLSLKVADNPTIYPSLREHHFDVENASGLIKNSAVKMAGIKVGFIKDIQLVKGKARVFLSFYEDVPLTAASLVEIRADGILGDKHVEILPGPITGTSQPLESGRSIPNSPNQASLGQMIKNINKVVIPLERVILRLEEFTIKDEDDTHLIGRIAANIEDFTNDLAEISGKNRERINNILLRTQSLMADLDNLVNDKLSTNVLRSVQNVEEITDKINSGDGTIGRLINDKETVEGLNEAIEGINGFLSDIKSLETSIDFHTEHLMNMDSSKTYVSARLTPGLDRYYEIGLVDDAKGLTRTHITEQTPLDGTTSEIKTVKTFKDRVKLTALFAKNFHNFTVKGGILESSGGLGLDYYLGRRNWRFSVEAFDFDNLYVRSFVRYNFFKGAYVIGGADHLLDIGGDGREGSFFLGAGIFLTNDDLKLLGSQFSF